MERMPVIFVLQYTAVVVEIGGRILSVYNFLPILDNGM